MQTLNQRFFFTTKRFELTENSLKTKVSKPGSLIENEFKFEEIGRKISKRKSISLIALALCLFFISATFITICLHLSGDKSIDMYTILTMFALAICTTILALSKYKNDLNLFLNDGRYIALYAASPSETGVDAFMDELRATQKKYLLKRYADNDIYIPDERKIEQLYWLRNIDIIDDIECESLKNQILKKDNIPPVLGFNFNQGNN